MCNLIVIVFTLAILLIIAFGVINVRTQLRDIAFYKRVLYKSEAHTAMHIKAIILYILETIITMCIMAGFGVATFYMCTRVLISWPK